MRSACAVQVSPKSSGHDAGSGVNQSGSGSGGRGTGATTRGGRRGPAAAKAEVRNSSRTDRQSSAEEPADEVCADTSAPTLILREGSAHLTRNALTGVIVASCAVLRRGRSRCCLDSFTYGTPL